jgi:hypothetical protein
MKAVERFDPAKGSKLSTYGSWWIKQSIKRALVNLSRTIRVPVHNGRPRRLPIRALARPHLPSSIWVGSLTCIRSWHELYK